MILALGAAGLLQAGCGDDDGRDLSGKWVAAADPGDCSDLVHTMTLGKDHTGFLDYTVDWWVDSCDGIEMCEWEVKLTGNGNDRYDLSLSGEEDCWGASGSCLLYDDDGLDCDITYTEHSSLVEGEEVERTEKADFARE
jgi:hypothetical protein